MDRMIRLVEHHRACHDQCVVQNPFPRIFLTVDVHKVALVLAGHVVQGLSTARVALDEVRKDPHWHVGPVELFDDLEEIY